MSKKIWLVQTNLHLSKMIKWQGKPLDYHAIIFSRNQILEVFSVEFAVLLFFPFQHAWPFYKNSAVRNWFLFREKKLEFCKKKCYPEFRSLIFQIWVISSRKKRPQLAHTNRWQPRSYFFVPRLSFVPCSLLIVRHVFKVTYLPIL